MPGRNEPCPCGSGRKYKHCCLNATEAADFRRRQLRAAEGRLVPELLELSLNECGTGPVDAALEEFFLWNGVPEGYEQTDEFSSFFVPWFVYTFVDGHRDSDPLAHAPREPLACLYLRRHAERLSPIEHAFLQSASGSALSFYAVTRTVPGREIALRDVLTGTDVVVREQSASGMVQAGALLFTRVLTVEDTSIMSGCAPLVIPPEWHLSILDLRDDLAGGKGRFLSRDRVRELDRELRGLYFRIEDEVFNPRPPELRNTDGDRLVITTLRYRLRCAPSSAFERLKSLARLAGDDATQLLAEAEVDESGDLRAFQIPWNKRGNRLHKDWETTSLGTITVDGDHLEIEVNSSRRARRIEREIAKRLGADALLESRTAEPIERLLAERRETPRDRLAELEQEKLQQLPEVQEFLRQQGERHWEAWLDTPLPALAGRTPRQAAGTPEGRERLEALLAEFGWRGEQSPRAMVPDIVALRAKLGLL
jgi:hypothetical protein